MCFSSRAKPRNHRRPSRPLTDHDVAPTDELQPWLEDQDVDDVDEVAGVVGQQPQVDVFGRLVGKRPAHGDQPHVPVPCCHHQEEPEDVDEICRDGKSSSLQSQRSQKKQQRKHQQSSLYQLIQLKPNIWIAMWSAKSSLKLNQLIQIADANTIRKLWEGDWVLRNGDAVKIQHIVFLQQHQQTRP